MKKICPKCNVEFECKADDIENCDCNTVQLNASTIALIKEKFEDCLCKKCLSEIDKFTISLSSNKSKHQKEI